MPKEHMISRKTEMLYINIDKLRNIKYTIKIQIDIGRNKAIHVQCDGKYFDLSLLQTNIQFKKIMQQSCPHLVGKTVSDILCQANFFFK